MKGKYSALVEELNTSLAHTYGSRLRGVYLFGSAERASDGPDSDVDILIVLDRVERYSDEIRATSPVISGLSLKYGKSISRVVVSENDWGESLTPFLATARSEAVKA